MKTPKANTTANIPVNPEVLIWARETAGLSPGDVADKLGRKSINAETISAWETGDGAPSYSQLEVLAYTIYRRPLALFFFPKPPQEETPEKSFRTLSKEVIQTLSPRIRIVIRRAQVMQLNLRELFFGANPAKSNIIQDLSFNLRTSLDEMVDTVRNFLNIDVDKQRNWKDTDQALREWREILYNNGVFVFKDAFEENAYSGFCLYDELFPIIYVNSSTTPARQIFTLFHEMAHLLFRTGGIDTRLNDYVSYLDGDAKKIETICNHFAGAFLVPNRDFNGRTKTVHTFKDALKSTEELAGFYHVSREVILRKFLDREVISHITYEKTVKEWQNEYDKRKELRKQKKTGGDYYNNRYVYLGRPYIEIAFSRYHQKNISFNQLAEYLGVKRHSVNELETRMFRDRGKL